MNTLTLRTDTKELTRECVGGSDLQQRKKEIEAYNEQTSSTLKQTCKKNYMQFIQTAKEISRMWLMIVCCAHLTSTRFFADLESEMYQLSHILIEQRNILATLTDGKTSTNLKADSIEAENNTAAEDVENSHATQAVKEMVQGFNGNLEGKTFLNEGALIELDGNDYRPIQRVFFFLFNDVLIVCKVKHDKYESLKDTRKGCPTYSLFLQALGVSYGIRSQKDRGHQHKGSGWC